jgi:integral membrane sensor domain MASE1
MTDFVLSLVMLTALALVAGAFVYWRRTGAIKQPLLMVLLALIALANVALLTIPTKEGVAPVTQIKERQEESEG